uniref:Uncharacterized protein n=1 Tax=Timema bartmani TaxID=61472 RepID=A0A7R9F0R3_9NEOP|nr:unnamed protein product [Timema bartmani]
MSEPPVYSIATLSDPLLKSSVFQDESALNKVVNRLILEADGIIENNAKAIDEPRNNLISTYTTGREPPALLQQLQPAPRVVSIGSPSTRLYQLEYIEQRPRGVSRDGSEKSPSKPIKDFTPGRVKHLDPPDQLRARPTPMSIGYEHSFEPNFASVQPRYGILGVLQRRHFDMSGDVAICLLNVSHLSAVTGAFHSPSPSLQPLSLEVVHSRPESSSNCQIQNDVHQQILDSRPGRTQIDTIEVGYWHDQMNHDLSRIAISNS